MNSPNWKIDIELYGKCGTCVFYKQFIKGKVFTARGKCSLKNVYKQRTEACLKYKKTEE